MTSVTDLLRKRDQAAAKLEKARASSPEAQALAEIESLEAELTQAKQSERQAAIKAARAEIAALTLDAQALQDELTAHMRATLPRAEALRSRWHRLTAQAQQYPELGKSLPRRPVGFCVDLAGDYARQLDTLDTLERFAIPEAQRVRQSQEADYKHLAAQVDAQRAKLAAAKAAGADSQARAALEQQIADFEQAAEAAKKRLDGSKGNGKH